MNFERIHFEELEGIRVGKFKGKINTTCIVYRIGSTLIDTGPSNQWETVQKFIKEKDLKQVIVTHHHEDHGGNGASIKSELNIPIYVHESGFERYLKGYKIRLYEKIMWGTQPTFEPEILPSKIELENNITLIPIFSPGHSIDMTCYLEPNKGWLFTGDTFISSKPTHMRKDEDPNTEIESLKALLNYDFDTVFCAHRGIVKNGKSAIKKKYEYLSSIREKSQNLYKEGKSANEITKTLIGKENFISYFTLFHFSSKNLISAFIK